MSHCQEWPRSGSSGERRERREGEGRGGEGRGGEGRGEEGRLCDCTCTAPGHSAPPCVSTH